MSELLQNFVESLRDELKQYGELLALLDLQQTEVVQRLPDKLLDTLSAINSQSEAIRVARHEREQRQRDLALSLHFAGEERLLVVIPRLPVPYQPLVRTLVEENNHLLARVKQRARQNQTLLRRSLDLMDQFINSICANGVPVYNEAGRITKPVLPSRPIYEDVC